MLKNFCCVGILVLVLALTACLPAPTPLPTSTPSPSPTIAPLKSATPAIPCELRAQSDITVYERPSTEADVFGVLSAGEMALITGITADGWLGFEPGVAQGWDSGIFRLRWIAGDTDMTLEGGCDALPLLVGPLPDVCFTMLMDDDTPVFAEPTVTSAIVVTLSADDYARIQGKTADNWTWFWVDLGVGNTGLDGTGWIPGAHVNLNGPCENLPVVTP